MNVLPVPKVKDLFAKAAEHVAKTGHKYIVQLDDPDKRLLGLHCPRCNLLWVTPPPGPGHFNDWPQDMMNPRTIEGRQEYLKRVIDNASRKSVWEWIKNPAV